MPAPPEQTSGEAGPAAAAARKKVLIIDDDPAFVTVMKEGLEAMGFKAAVAFDGLQGLLQAHQFQPDVILLDFHMPAGGGSSAYERLRSAPDTGSTPVVFTTAARVEDVRASIRPGPKTFFLKKPVTLTHVKTVLEKVLNPAAPGPRSSEESKAVCPPEPSRAPSGGPQAEAPRAEGAPPAPATGGASAADPGGVSAPPASGGAALPDLPRFKEPVEFSPAQGGEAAAFRPPFDLPAPPGPGSKPAGRTHEFDVRVIYGDTDKMGVIYYANYFKYFEQGRTELIRSIGIRYRDLEVERRLHLPVTEARCVYRGPSRYDDLLRVRTWLSRLGHASITFRYEIVNADAAGRTVATGYTRHAVVDERWRPLRVPVDLAALLKPFVSYDK